MKPILFSTPMVQAILDGRKTMTRRVINRMSGVGTITEFGESGTRGYKWQFRDKRLKWHDVNDIPPPYSVGDTLWVRETFVDVPDGSYLYQADHMYDDCGKGDFAWHWKPSIHMSREAARLFLEVKKVEVERLNNISLEGKIAEGFSGCFLPNLCSEKDTCPDDCFIKLWDALYAKRGYSWENNPWVYVIEFKRIV
ncbi:MAG: hypothetical protein LBB22_04475 [Treponema sp.]|jgi:hypothetical protein|nr:hypothetical protein [Treponema sp.]